MRRELASDSAHADPGSVLSLKINSVFRGGSEVLRGVNLEIMRRETVALVGPSGIGKSTLLMIVAGILHGFRGRVSLQGSQAMVFQEPRLLPWRTLTQNLTVATGTSQDKALALLADAGLDGRGDDYPGELSLGQARRVAIVRAFAANPDLLLMDEPFASLDSEAIDKMMRLFVRLRERTGIATLFVTHIEDEAKRLASRIVALGGTPAGIVGERQNMGAYFHSSASGVTALGS